ncbi:MAG TPA: hypothetical protein DIC18_01275 [Clostridiales bacterium]|nr:hypothetical protein [Clostridiales bacterium]HCU55948.1 hypothetical protein [Clostridiales bacterium]
MTICFCGHSEISGGECVKRKILAFLQTLSANENITFFIGGYGDFDHIALNACLEYKAQYNSQTIICFITPYNSEDYFENRKYFLGKIDQIVYPELENVPKRYAIVYRNRWMIRNSDIVVCYIDHTWGGAYKTYKYALNKKKTVINVK